MASKPRMGSDPFQKKDPLGWIGGDTAEKEGKKEGLQGGSGNPEKLSKPSRSSTQGPQSKTGNSSNHDLLSPPSSPGNLGTPGMPPRGTTTSKGLRPGWTRATFIVREETFQQLKAVAYWDRKELKRVVEEAFKEYLQDRVANPIPTAEAT